MRGERSRRACSSRVRARSVRAAETARRRSRIPKAGWARDGASGEQQGRDGDADGERSDQLHRSPSSSSRAQQARRRRPRSFGDEPDLVRSDAGLGAEHVGHAVLAVRGQAVDRRELADDAPPGAQAPQHDDEVEHPRDVVAQVRHGQVAHALAGEQLEPEQGVLGAARVDRRGGAVVPGVERLERVEGLLRQPDLADDEAVRAHPEGVRHEITDVEQARVRLARREIVRVERLEVEAVRVLERELGRVLDDADPLGLVEQVRDRAQERRLAGTRLARDQDVRARTHEAGHDLRHRRVEPALLDPAASVPAAGREVEAQAVELADREVRPADGRDDGVHARSVGHPRIDHRVRDRQLATGEGGDPLGDLDDLARGPERHRRPLEAAGALDEDLVRAVDEDVADQRVVDERLQWTETADGGLDRGHQGGRRRELEVRLGEDVADRASEPRLLLGRPAERVEILGRQARHEQASDRAQRRGRDRALIGCRANDGRHRLPPGAGIVARTDARTERRRTVRGWPSGEQRPRGPRDGREVVPQVGCDRPRGLAAVGGDGEDRIRPDAADDRDVRLAGKPADLGVVVGAARDERELAAHPLGAHHGREPEDVGQRLERRAHDAEHEVRLVDQLPVALLEEAAEIDDQQVVPGTLRALDELARLRGAEHARGPALRRTPRARRAAGAAGG